MKTEFSTLDIVKGLGIHREPLRDWMNRGFVTPTRTSAGQGTKAVFTLLDVYGVALFRSLVNYGFSRQVAGDYVKDFIKHEEKEPDRQKTAYLVLRESVGGRRSIMTYAEGDWKINIKTGLTDEIQVFAQTLRLTGLAVQAVQERSYRILHIVNFGTLRKEVDMALSKV